MFIRGDLWRRLFVLSGLVIGVFILVVNSPIEAQDVRPSRLSIEQIPHLAGERGTETVQTVQSPEILPWSKVAFQSFRDDNWNIYVGNDDGSGQARLTANNAPEIQPHLNRGNTQIVYARKNGDYDVFKMNVDGSNQIALTNDATDDGNPVWSPDGTKIAFESYRDGQAEIYVMNANGTGQTRLTAQSDFDGMPTWSPDGTKIAFVSRRTGGYRIWVMNANGTNQVQVSTQPYSLRPQWSPDGTQIAFDADDDGDGWQDLWRMNADGSGQVKVHDPYGTTDAWAGSWSPDGRFIAFTTISFTQYQGNWYWTEAFIDALYWQGSSFFRLSYNSRDWTPRWQSSDNRPPISSISKLPAFTSTAYSAIGWNGHDIGSAGFGGFNIHYRQGENGVWKNWINDSAENEAEFPSTAGTTVQFRGRAHDNAYNWENWPSGAETQTTFYNWSFSGTVTDNRGTPLNDKEIAVTPSTVSLVTTNESGAYDGYTLSSGEHALLMTDPQYGQFGNTQIQNWESFDQTYYMAPSDNLLQNSSFEVNNGQPTGWNVNGNLFNKVINDLHVSGENAYVMGSICSHPVCLSSAQTFELSSVTSGNAYSMVVEGDDLGRLHLIIPQMTNSNLGIYYSFRSIDGSWSEPVLIDQSPVVHYGVRLYLKIDSLGTLHAVWIGEEGLKYVYKPENGQWSTAKILANLEYGSNFYVADFEIDRDDGIHLLIRQRGGIYYLERTPNGQWQNLVSIWHESAESLFLAVGPDNAIHVAWQITYSSDPAGDHLLFYRVRSPEGVWLPREVLFNRDDFFATWVAGLEVDNQGRVHYLWDERLKGSVFHSVKSSGQWSTPVKLDTLSGSFEVKTDTEGNLLFMDHIGDSLKYRYYTYENGWSVLSEIEPGGSNPTLQTFEIDPDNFLHLITYNLEDNSFQYQRTEKAGFQDVAEISQEVTIPANMNAPTLSFMAKAIRDETSDDTGLKIFVTDGTGTTAVFAGTVEYDWSHHWVDLEVWRGEEITITFQLDQKSDDPEMQLYLDDISLGSAYPDIWVKAAGTNIAKPGEQVVYEVSYGNQGGVMAQDIALTISLPSELDFQGASIAPISTSPLTWDVGSLSASSGMDTFTITATVKSSVIPMLIVSPQFEIDMLAAEMEVGNNVYALDLFIGERVYLPMINR